ncbi:NEP1 ribosome biogenesis domain-containing protein [Cryptosporidium andersoni]|uniref:NEP1 ribosome biogenesis domain-containing protein n=1 Tax=Cryptosporidium andersoni TaxID=117008 RepID=A0A1J4MXC8_9CRYT|nr:NEP1 ribosome biogenesis domain-containing protein [Cryptosporidium andersoni]
MNSNIIKVPKDLNNWLVDQKLVILLDQACLELVETKNKALQLLNGLVHSKKYIDEYLLSHPSNIFSEEEMMLNIRPDILHQCLLALLDSPLNKKGKLMIYIRTTGNVLIEVNPQLTVPRYYDEFANLMINLLVKRKVKACEENSVLMRIIKNDINKVLPPGGLKFGLSVKGNPTSLRKLLRSIYIEKKVDDSSSYSKPITFLVGAVAYGDPALKSSLVESIISISSYPLSAALCCAKLCTEFEYIWKIS